MVSRCTLFHLEGAHLSVLIPCTLSECYEGMRGPKKKKSFLHLEEPIKEASTSKHVQRIMGAKCTTVSLQHPLFQRALWNGQFWAPWIKMTLLYGGPYCFHPRVPFGGRFIQPDLTAICTYFTIRTTFFSFAKSYVFYELHNSHSFFTNDLHLTLPLNLPVTGV